MGPGRPVARPRADGERARLYVESLNDMFDDENARVVALSNRVPTAVFLLEILGSAFALGLLAAYLAILGRGELSDRALRRSSSPSCCSSPPTSTARRAG